MTSYTVKRWNVAETFRSLCPNSLYPFPMRRQKWALPFLLVPLLAIGLPMAVTHAADSTTQENQAQGSYAHPTANYVKSIRQAVVNNDYTAWATLMNQHTKTAKYANQETFNKVVQAYQYRQQGDFKEARSIMKELGFGKELVAHRQYIREQVRLAHQAVASNDYNTWADIASQLPNADTVVNQDTFNKLVEAYNLRKEGKFKQAHQIIKGLHLMPMEHMMGR